MPKRNLSKYCSMLLLAIVVATIILITPKTVAQEKILRIYTGTPSTFNPLLVPARIEGQREWTGLTYESLLYVLFNGSLVPCLAESWEILDGGKRFVFHIDKRAKWSDGVPFTARDVVFTWNLTKRLYGRWTGLENILSEVRLVDDYTVEFVCIQPYSRWHLTFGTSYPVPAHIFETLEDPLSYECVRDPSKHVTTGPFIFDSFEEAQWWFFRKRPDYWKTEWIPRIDGVLCMMITDVTTQIMSLSMGEVDIIMVGVDVVEQVLGLPNVGIWQFPYPMGTEWMCINTRIYPLSLKEVRQAIDLALDKKKFAQDFMKGYAMPGNRCLINLAACPEFATPNSAWPGYFKTHEECVAEANRILDSLGFTRGSDGIRVTPNGTRLSFNFIYQGFPISAIKANMAEEIARNLNEIGIELSVQQFMTLDFFTVTFSTESPDWGLSMGTYGEHAEPYFVQVWHFKGPPSRGLLMYATNWTHPEVNASANRAFTLLDYNEFVNEVKNIIRIYADELPVITVVFYPMSIYAYRTDTLTNWQWEASFITTGFGYPMAQRPLTVTLLTPPGWAPTPPPATPTPAPTGPTPTPTPTGPTPAPTPKPTPTPTGPTPTPAATPTPTPTAAPTGMPTEQIISIAVVVIVIIAIIGYIVVRARKKAT
ncbi:MAG: ABC transporter substrate-binding protein [Candidatus Bathyarchaeia archaeon]